MTRRLSIPCAVAAALAFAAPARADHWPLTGGTPSRTSTTAGVDRTPIAPAWSAPDGTVLTPMLISGGGGSGQQRVAYGTSDGYLHLRLLGSGEPVGPGEGSNLDGGSVEDDGAVFGAGAGAVGFADTSSEDRLGQLFVVHNDDPVAAAAVFIARLRLDTGEMLPEVVVPQSAQCSINSSPLMTPPAAGGSRILYFTMSCPLYRYLVRVPIMGDAASPDATLGSFGFGMVSGLTPTASPMLAVLREPDGRPSYHVAVARQGGLTLFDADDPLESAPGSTVTPPAITAELADPAEIAQTPSAPVTAHGQLAGGEGSGTGPAPAVYVAADASGATRIYKFVQDDAARALRAVAVTGPLPASGAPSPGMALTETVAPEGVLPGGTLLVTSAANLTLLRTSDLSVAAQASGTPLPAGLGFSRTLPMISGAYAFVVRDGDSDSPAEHLVLRLDGLTPLQPPAFSPAPDPVPGAVAGQPAGSHGHVAFGTARGPFVYAAAGARPSPGDKISELPPRACAKQIDGSRRADRITGSADGDRILGGPGDDRLAGAGGPDCVFGQADDDVISGGAGNDLLEGGSGADRLSGGPGRNQLVGGAGRDRLRGGSGRDRIAGGPGNDRIRAVRGGADRIDCGRGRDVVVADRRDRVGGSCERILRRR